MDYSLLLSIEKNWDEKKLQKDALERVRLRYQPDEIIMESDFEVSVKEEKRKIKDCIIYALYLYSPYQFFHREQA